MASVSGDLLKFSSPNNVTLNAQSLERNFPVHFPVWADG